MSEDKFPVNLDVLTADISSAEKEKIWSEIERQIDEIPSTKGTWRNKTTLFSKYKGVAGSLSAGLVAVVLVLVVIPVLLRQAGHVQIKPATTSSASSSASVTQVATEAVVLDQVTPFPWRIEGIHKSEELATQTAPKSFESLFSSSNIQSHLSLNSRVQYSAAEKKQWLTNGQNLINDLFVKGTPTYTHEMKTLTSAVQSANGSNLSIDGGVSSLQWSTANRNIFNGMVTLKGMGDNWAVYAQWQPDQKKYVPANPHNKVNYTLKLKKVNGKWMVESLEWSFAKGSEP